MRAQRRRSPLPALVAVAAHGLPQAGDALAGGMPTSPLPAGHWELLLRQAHSHRMSGFIVEALSDGALPATSDQAESALAAHEADMAQVLRLDRLLLDVRDLFREEGIEFRVLKGAALAKLDYEDPSLRPYGDVDVLVGTERFDDTVRALIGAGGCRLMGELRPGFDRRFGKGATIEMPGGLQLDLHRTFVYGRFGLSIALDDLFASGAPFEIGGTGLEALAVSERFIHACYHAAVGNRVPRLVALRDIAQLLTKPELESSEVLRIARRWHAEAVVARGARLVAEDLGCFAAHPITEWARSFRPSTADRRAVEVYLGTRSAARLTIDSLAYVPGMRAKAALLTAVVVPQRAALDVRTEGHGVGSWWARGLRRVFGFGRR